MEYSFIQNKMPSYADKIADATTKKELINYKKQIEKSTYLKSKNLDGELLKMIDDKMDSMNDNDISDDGRLSELADAAAAAAAEHMALPPPAKRAKNDDTLKILIEKKSHAEYELYKAKSDYDGYLKNREEIMNKVGDFIIDEEDKEDEEYKANLKDFLISDLVSEIDRSNFSLKQTKQCAEIFIITCWIKESYERKIKYEKEYLDARKELKEYNKVN